MDIPHEHRPSESYRQRRSAEPTNHQVITEEFYQLL